MANWATQSATREYNVTPNGELTVVERLASLLETGQFADVEIKVGTGSDTQSFKAHRILLATASQPLSTLIAASAGRNPTPGETVTIHVTDIDPESFQHILKYIYTDDVKISSVSEAIDLVKYAEKWGLEPLGKKTVKFIHQYLDEFEPTSEEYKNDLCELTIWTEDEQDKLNLRCWETLLKYVNDVIPCQGFLSMSEEMIKRLLTHKDFQYRNQLDLFEAIRDWGMNQVLEKNLPVGKLQSVIGKLLQYIKMDGIKDDEFISTVLPSECLDKADIISYFMTRGLAIPRDLALNNNIMKSTKNGSISDHEKAIRFKKGYKIPDQEIYREHELRFRVDSNVILLGVAFGFLFSDTDMGITVHCKGPWETNQWEDIVQTYCRVSWESMKTADIRLMFSEPVHILAKHSYKILVRVGRMSAGVSEVDLWGGGENHPSVKSKDAVFHFLKNAVAPENNVEDKDIDNKPSMITELIYELEGAPNSAKAATPDWIEEKPTSPPKLTLPLHTSLETARSPVKSPVKSPAPSIFSPSSPRPFSPPATPLPRPYSPCASPMAKPFSPVIGPLTPGFPSAMSSTSNSYSPISAPVSVPVPSRAKSPVLTRKLQIPETIPKKSYLTQLSKMPEPEPPWVKRRTSITATDEGKTPASLFRVGRDAPEPDTRHLPWQRKASLTKKEELPSFTLKPRPPASSYTRPLESPKSSWSIPSRYKPASSSSYVPSSVREPSVTRAREPSVNRTREYTPVSSRAENSYSKYGTPSKLGSSYNVATPYSSYKSPGLSTSSRYGQMSTTPRQADTSTSKYGSSTLEPRLSDTSTSKYGSFTSTPRESDTSTSKYGSSTSTARPSDATTSKYSSAVSSPYSSRLDQSSSTANASSASPYGSTSGTSRYGQLSNSVKASSPAPFSSSYSRYGTSASSYAKPTTNDTSSSSSRYGKSSFDSPSSKYGTSSTADSPSTGSRYGSSYKSSQPSTENRYGSSYSRPSDTTKDPAPAASKFGQSYSTYKPMSSVASRLGDTSSYKKESTPSSYSRNSPFPSRISSGISRFSGSGPSSSSSAGSYYRR